MLRTRRIDLAGADCFPDWLSMQNLRHYSATSINMRNKQYSITRNSLYNVLGWVIPIIVNFVSIPIIVAQLGYDQYGVWVLVMAVMGYFALLDLGVVKGGIRFLAEYSAANDMRRASQVISLGFYAYLLIGLLGCGLTLLCTDPVLLPLIKLPDELHDLARQVFHLAAFGFLVTMLQTYMLSLPQAVHRFDISNKVDTANQILTTAATVIALSLGFGLVSIIVIRIVGSILCCASLYHALKKCLPDLRLTIRFDQGLARMVFSYSLVSFVGRLGTTTANHLQTIVIGSILGTTAVTIFSVPFQLISRVMSLSYRLSMVIFPISSELGAGEANLKRLHEIYLTMGRNIFFLNIMQVVLFSLFSWDLLSLWMGRDFADKSSLILTLLAIGVFFDSLTNLPSQICDGLSHPRITSTFAFIRGAIGILFVLIGGHVAGVLGVAAGFTLSCIIMSLAFNIYVHPRIIKLSMVKVALSYAEITVFGLLVLASFIPLTVFKPRETLDVAAFLLKGSAAGLAFCLYGYARLLDGERKRQLHSQLGLMLRKAVSAK